MTRYQTDRKQQSIRIDGIPYAGWEIEMIRMNIPAGSATFRQALFMFLCEWFDASDTVRVHTSGSTGPPKPMRVEKERMMQSACLTCSFLGLQEGDTALLCLPLQYIAGKMVVVRSLVAGLDLLPVSPSGHPLSGLAKAPAFAAMIPMQVFNSLHVPEEKKLLRQIRHLIIGGGAVDGALAKELVDFPHAVWSTYGMTETLSHIAMRRLNGEDASEWYTPFEGVNVRLGGEGTLLIDAPRVCADELATNDMAEVDAGGRFRILGRKDNTVNSGGVKIQLEQVEAALSGCLKLPFVATSAPDARFGEIIVLLVEGAEQRQTRAEIQAVCDEALPPYWRPKRIVFLERLPLTGNGKPDRAAAKEWPKR